MTVYTKPPASTDIPIAVIGMSCRFPGDINSPSKLWEMCAEGKSAWSEIPEDRFSPSKFYHPTPGKSGCFPVKGGHFLTQDLAHFDARFFNTNVQEAEAMDPQQRLLMECSYEALENAGIPMERIVSTDTGVYMASSSAEYLGHLLKDTDNISMYQPTGSLPSILSNRISYFFDLKGPSITVDTGCSASLVALHLACKSLQLGESRTALVGGAHILLGPEYFISMGMAGFFSEDGRSYAFDDRACGFGRGEGAVCVALKPLSEAIRQGDPIRAVIRSTGVNQDGRTQGITMPNGESQASLIRSVYTSINLDPGETQYVEAHGTGTAKGDPIEANALAAEFCRDRDEGNPLLIGSVKTNIGHLEGASGLAGLVKAVLMLEKQTVLPNTNFKNPNPEISFEKLNIKVPTELIPYSNGGLSRASINGFGFGGTNAHAVIENVDHFFQHHCQSSISRPQPNTPQECSRMYVLSAHTKESALAQAEQLKSYLDGHQLNNNTICMASLAHTLNSRRSRLPWRLAYQASGMQELREALCSSHLEPSRPTREPGIGFVFTGQGAQWASMGMRLLKYEEFRRRIGEADKTLRSFGATWSLIDELSKEASSTKINESHISQPACTAIQIGLVELLASWNLKPRAVVGHSSGEIAASYTTGALDLKSAMAISYYRGVLVRTAGQQHDGSMLAVGAGEDELKPLIKGLTKGQVSIACFNSPQNITVSGDNEAISGLQSIVSEKGYFNRKLATSSAYHSYHMECVEYEYKEVLLPLLKPQRSDDVRFYSSLYGTQISTDAVDATYWTENLRNPVRFSNAISALLVDVGNNCLDIDTIIEIGPHPALQQPVKQTMAMSHASLPSLRYLPTLLRGKDEMTSILNTACCLFQNGAQLDVSAVNRVSQNESLSVLSDLPPYPWRHVERYWIETRYTRNHRFSKFPRNDLLGTLKLDSIDLEPTWRNTLSVEDLSWLSNRATDTFEYPISGYISMAVEAVHQTAIADGIDFTELMLRDIVVIKPLELSASKRFETQITLRPPSGHTTRGPLDVREWNTFEIFSWTEDDGWCRHCRGFAAVHSSNRASDTDEGCEKGSTARKWRRRRQDIESACTKVTEGDQIHQLYEGLYKTTSSECLKGIDKIRTAPGLALTEFKVPDTASTMPSKFENPVALHPTVIEPLFQSINAAFTNGKPRELAPVRHDSIEEVKFCLPMKRQPGSELHIYTQFERLTARKLSTFAFYFDGTDGYRTPCLEVKGLISTYELQAHKSRTLCYQTQWKPHPRLVSGQHFHDIQDYSAFESVKGHQKSRIFGTTSHALGDGYKRDPIKESASRTHCHDSACSSTTESPLKCQYLLEDSLNDLIKEGVLPQPATMQPGLALALARITSYLDLFVHERPNSSILCIGPILATTLASLTARLQDRADAIDLGGVPIEIFEAATGTIEETSCKMGYKELRTCVTSENQATEGYDAIIFTPCSTLFSQSVDTPALLQKLTKPDAHIIHVEPKSLQHHESSSQEEPGSYHSVQRQGENNTASNEWDHMIPSPLSESLSTQGWSVKLFEKTNPTPCDMPDLIIIAKSAVPGLNHTIHSAEGPSPSVKSLEMISPQDTVNKVCIILATDDPILRSPSAMEFSKLQAISSHCSGILWVSQAGYENSSSPDSAMAAGLGRTIRWENPGLRFVLLDLDSRHNLKDTIVADTIRDVLRISFSDSSFTSRDMEFMERDGIVRIPRITVDDVLNRHLFPPSPLGQPVDMPLFACTHPLQLSSEASSYSECPVFVENGFSTTPIPDDWVEVEIKACAVTTEDATKIEAGMFEDSGFVYSGVIRVMGRAVEGLDVHDRVCVISTGGLANIRRCPAQWTLKIPDGMSFSEAASCWSAHCTAGYALLDFCNLSGKQTVLVHNASGRVGQAAVQLLRSKDAKILATVDSVRGREVIMERYGIPDDCIFYRSETLHADDLLPETDGKGIDLVFDPGMDSQSDYFDTCLGSSGCYIYVQQGHDLAKVPKLSRNQRISMIDIQLALVEHPESVMRVANKLIDLWRQGVVKSAYPLHKFPLSQVSDALNTARSTELVGDVVVEIGDSDRVKVIQSPPKDSLFRHDSTYLITGGTGGLGRCLARWIVENGGRHIVLASRSGGKSSQISQLTNELAKSGAHVEVQKCDIQESGQVDHLIERISGTLPPLRGVIHAPWIPLYTIFEQMSHENYMSAIKPKVDGAWNLHHSTLTQNLDFFVMMSSVHGIFGNRGQSSTAAAHTFLDAFMQYRLSHGLPAITVDLPIVDEVGYMAENAETMDMVSSIVYDRVDEQEFLSLMEMAIRGRPSGLGPSQPHRQHIITGLTVPDDSPLPFWMEDARFSHINRRAAVGGETEGPGKDEIKKADNIRIALQGVHSKDEACVLVCQAVLQKVSTLAMILLDELNESRPLTEYGLDSISAIEIRNWVKRDLGSMLGLQDLLYSASVMDLSRKIVEMSEMLPKLSVVE